MQPHKKGYQLHLVLVNECYKPIEWVLRAYEKKRPKLPPLSLDDNFALVRKVQVTPSNIFFLGAQVMQSNHILRAYPKCREHFLRVSFMDEDGKKLQRTSMVKPTYGTNTTIHERIPNTILNGIHIGDKHFEFLAFSTSQLRENSQWMLSRYDKVDAAEIWNRMGDLSSIRNLAKHATRMGQSLSLSKKSFNIEKSEIEFIRDIKVEIDGVKYLFYGIGRVSLKFAEKITDICGFKNVPSTFQIRYAG